MPKASLIRKYAQLAANMGANVQKDQQVVVRASTENKELVREITKAAYEAGAKRVHVDWGDDYISRHGYDFMSLETLQDIPEWRVEKTRYFVTENACFISVTSPIPGLNKGVDPDKMQKASQAAMKKLSFFQNHLMGNKTQWTILGAPNPVWAKKVFADMEEAEAVEALWNAIFEASRVREDNDPVKEWDEHNAIIAKNNRTLNDHQFKSLHFQNSLGTDITVGLVENHVWAGGNEHTIDGVAFNPNIPTEENFTMPHKTGTNGKVVATKPLDYQGKLIEDFWLEFKDGKVVDYDAKKEKEALKNLIEYDEGSAYLGEIALISHDSPISNSGVLYYNTLFDENASCHMALGRAYPMNVETGVTMKKEELEAIGYNSSLVHSDFMFGSADLQVTGITKDGKKITIFKDGNFVI